MYDLKRSQFGKTIGRDLAAGTIVEQEGCLLCAVLEDGVEKAALVSSVASTDKVLGVAKTADSQPSRTSKVEAVLIPSAAPYTAQLSEVNLVSGRVRVVVAGSALTVVTGAPSAGEVQINHTTGTLTFNSAEAGSSAEVTYLFDLTVVQSKQRFGERHVNNRDLHSEFGKVEVGTDFVEFYTDQFDASADYSSGSLKLMNNGMIGKSGSGPVLSLTVIHVPSAALPLLGVRGKLG